jgi:hypothetical protein
VTDTRGSLSELFVLVLVLVLVLVYIGLETAIIFAPCIAGLALSIR